MLICGCRAGTRPSVRVRAAQLPNFAGTLLCLLFVDGLTLHPVGPEQHRSLTPFRASFFRLLSRTYLVFGGRFPKSFDSVKRSSNFFPSDSLLTDRMNVSLCCFVFFFSDASSARRLSVSPLMLQAGLVASFSLSSFMNDPPPSLFTPSSALSGASGAPAWQPSPWQPPLRRQTC